MSTSELPGAIHDLASDIVDMIESGDFESIEDPWIREEYVTISLGDDEFGDIISHSKEEEITKQSWDNDDVEEVIDSIEESEIYEECRELMSRRIGDESSDHEHALYKFIHDIIRRSTEPINDRQLTNLASVFVSELEDSPIYWEGDCWIDGISVENSIRLTENITLRDPTDDDLRFEYPKNSPRFANRNLRNVPSAILELSSRTDNSEDLDKLRTNTLNTLALYDLSSVSEIFWDRTSEGFNIRNQGGSQYYTYDINRREMSHIPFSTSVLENEENSLRDFYAKLEDIVEEHIQKADEDYLTIAFDRYQSAISDADSNESRLTSAIMALEALLLGAEGELADKLSRRAGTLLGIYDYNSIEVYKKVKKAYDVRSDYVHGSKIDEDISNLTERIVNYARLILIVEIQIHGEIKKSSLLSDLDHSGLHEDAKDSLAESLDDLVTVSP
jgi:hypothetical protein